MGNVFSFSISISVDDVLSRCWDCTTKPTKNVRALGENLDALRTECEELKRIRNDVKRRVDVAEEQQMQRLDQVEGWMVDVEHMEAAVDKLMTDGSQEIDQNCLGGCCPKNCKASYQMGKKVAKKLEEVVVLKSKGVFEVVADKRRLASMNKRPSEPTVGLQSTFGKVWTHITDEKVGIIGLYGMGGVGKTTLLTEINNKLCNTSPRFDVVIWVVVSKTPNPIKVQDDIGKMIGFQGDSWKNKSQDEKAVDIFQVLSKKKFVLLLDDIWERFELTEVGVPLPNEENKSKVVFTTRFEDVCGLMEAHKKTKVECLAWEEAWDLFQKKVGEEILNFCPEITKLAKAVARECDGLPLALITIGRAMAYKKTPQEWNHAIQVLQKSAAGFLGMGEKVFSPLKFSYDSLRSDTNRSCFLYCSLFPEDYLISKEKLISYWISEGFLDGFEPSNGARNQGHEIIGTLIQACLLEEDSSSDVKMHDVIRDMALWISCECGTMKDKVLVQAGAGLEKAPVVEKWKMVERMSLMHNYIEELTEVPSCPNLLTLLLNNNNLKTITSGFFLYMPNLRVLNLSRNYDLDELPMEISKLVSLQCLDVGGTNIKELPIEFKNLVNLKYLGLYETRRLDIIPRGVLSSLKMLQGLTMFDCGSFDVSVKDSVLSSGVEILVKEFECLKDLIHLSITINTTFSLSHILSSPRLLSYTRILSLRSLRGSKYVDMSFLEIMRCLNGLQIKDCVDLEDLRVERAAEGIANSDIISHPCFHSVRFVGIINCPLLKELTWLIFLPNLENLWIINCNEMEEVICGGRCGEATEERYLNLFAKLRRLHLENLPQLKSIYPNALPFPCLVEITVLKCPNLKKLPLNSSNALGCQLATKGLESWWNELEWEDKTTPEFFSSRFLPLKGD